MSTYTYYLISETDEYLNRGEERIGTSRIKTPKRQPLTSERHDGLNDTKAEGHLFASFLCSRMQVLNGG